MAAFGANAGTLTPAVAGGTVFAAEAFQGATATDANTAITPGAVTYAVATTGGIVVNAGGSIYYYVRLSNGKFATAPQATAVTGSVRTLLGGSVTVVGISADKTTALVKLTNTTTSTVNIGVGGTIIHTPATGAIDTVKTALATAGGTEAALRAGPNTATCPSSHSATAPSGR